MAKVSEIRVQRLSAGSILKISLFVVVPGLALGVLFGLFALLGFNTVRWDGGAVLGVNGLLLGVAMSLVASVVIAVANALLIGVGMLFVSLFKTTKIQYRLPRVKSAPAPVDSGANTKSD